MNHLLRFSHDLFSSIYANDLPVCLCLTSLQQGGHLKMAPPFTVPCEGGEAR